jgi:hypothetical protein
MVALVVREGIGNVCEGVKCNGVVGEFLDEKCVYAWIPTEVSIIMSAWAAR